MTRAALLAAALLVTALAAHAQPAPAKKELVQKLLQLQQPLLDGMARETARALVEQPAAQMMQAAGARIATLPADKREAAARQVDADARRYIDETTPIVSQQAMKALPSTIGAMLEDRMSEDELRQLIAWFESPVSRKYQGLSAEMQRNFVQKTVADSRPLVEPRIQALEQKVRATLGLPAAAASGAASGAASRPASP